MMYLSTLGITPGGRDVILQQDHRISLTGSAVSGTCYNPTTRGVYFVHGTESGYDSVSEGETADSRELDLHCVARQKIHSGYHCFPLT